MIKEFIIRTEDESTKVVKAIVKVCREVTKKYNAEFYTRELQQKNFKQIKITSIPKEQREEYFEGRRS